MTSPVETRSPTPVPLASDPDLQSIPDAPDTMTSYGWRTLHAFVALRLDDDPRTVMAKVSIWLHWLAAILALLLLLLPPTNGTLAAKIAPLAVAAILFSIFLYRFPWVRFTSRLFILTSFLDIGLIAAGVAVSGGPQSRYSLLLFLVVVFASYFYRVRDAAIVTGFTIFIFCLPLVYAAHSAAWLLPLYASASGVMALVGVVTKQTVLRVEAERSRRDQVESERNAAYEQEVLRRTALQQKTRQLESILEMGNALRLQLGLDTMLQLIASAISETSGFSVVVLRLFDQSSGAAVCRAVHGESWERVGLPTPPELIRSLMSPEFRVSRSYLVEVQPETLEDPEKKPYLRVGPASGYETGEWKAVHALIVPLETREHGLIGIISIDDPADGRLPTLETIQTLEIFANLAATAIDNARLLEEASQAQALRELDRLKSDFLATISHDLRTPLTVIKGSVDLMESHSDGLTSVDRQLVAGIGRNTRRLMDMVEQLLEMIQLQEGKTILHRQVMDIVDVVTDTAESLSLAAQSRGQHIVVTSPSEPTALPIDRRRVQQILTNLIGNACKYGPENKAIDVTISPCESDVVISVHDFGTEIPTEDRRRIFEKFYRTDQAVSNVSGSGLGLAICQSLVELHGGRIWIEGGANQGNTFSFSLPKATHPA